MPHSAKEEERIDVDYDIWKKQRKDIVFTRIYACVMTVVTVFLTFQTIVLQPTFWKAIMVEQVFLKALSQDSKKELDKHQKELEKLQQDTAQKKEQEKNLDREYRFAQIELMNINLIKQMIKENFLEETDGYMFIINQQLAKRETEFQQHLKELRVKVIKDLPSHVQVKF